MCVAVASILGTNEQQLLASRKDNAGQQQLQFMPLIVTLEKNMNTVRMISAVIVCAAAGAASAQQTEFVAPDAGFTSTATRAEVRQAEAQAYANGTAVQQQRDGQYRAVAASRSREEVREEAASAAKARRTVDVNSFYFGA